MATEAFQSPGARQTRSETDDLTLAIVEAVAAAKGVDPMTLDSNLAEQVDLDALAALYTTASQRPDTTWTVEFTVDGWTVTVRSDGDITVS